MRVALFSTLKGFSTLMRLSHLFVAILAASTIGLGIINNAASAQTLTAGDFAIVSFNATNPDSFALVALTNLNAGTVLNITDNAYTNTGTLATTEGILTYTAPAGGITAGTVLRWTDGGTNSVGFDTAFAPNPGFSASGDNLFIYTGTAATPTFIYGITTRSFLTTGTTSSNTTYLPPSLTNGVTAVDISSGTTVNNGVYSGTFTGTKSQLLTSISNPANWTTSGGTSQGFGTLPTSFTVNAVAVPETNTIALLAFALPAIGAVIARRRK